MPERAKLHFTISSRSLSMRCESLWGKKSTEYSHLPSGDEWRTSSWWLTCAWWSSICLKTVKRRHKPSICYIRTWTNSTSESEQTRMSLTNSDDQKKSQVSSESTTDNEQSCVSLELHQQKIHQINNCPLTFKVCRGSNRQNCRYLKNYLCYHPDILDSPSVHHCTHKGSFLFVCLFTSINKIKKTKVHFELRSPYVQIDPYFSPCI